MAVQNRLGHEAWGLYAALLSFSFLFIVLTDLGLNQYLTKTLAGNPGAVRELYPNVLGIKLLLFVLYPLLMLGIGWAMGYRGQAAWFLLLLSLMWGFHQLTAFFRSNFQAMQHFHTDSLAGVLDRLVLLLITLLLLATGIGITDFVMARLVAAALTTFVFAGVLLRIYGWMPPRLSLSTALPVLRRSLPFAMIVVLNSLHDKIDQVMLQQIAGETETGLYVAAYRWVDVFSMYLWTLMTIFYARFALHQHDAAELTKLLRFSQAVAAAPMVLVCVWVMFEGEVLLWMYTNSSPAELQTMGQSLRIVFGAMLVHSLFVAYGTMLSTTGRERFVNAAILLSVVMNISLNALLIPSMGAEGAATATLISYFVMCMLFLWRVQRLDKVQVPWQMLGKVCLSGLLLAAVCRLLQLSGLHWIASAAAASMAYAIIVWVLGIIQPAVLLEAWRTRNAKMGSGDEG